MEKDLIISYEPNEYTNRAGELVVGTNFYVLLHDDIVGELKAQIKGKDFTGRDILDSVKDKQVLVLKYNVNEWFDKVSKEKRYYTNLYVEVDTSLLGKLKVDLEPNDRTGQMILESALGVEVK